MQYNTATEFTSRSAHLAGAQNVATLRAGDLAPDFVLRDMHDNVHSLSDFRGSPIVIVFQPPKWTLSNNDVIDRYNSLARHSPGVMRAEMLSVENAGRCRELQFEDSTLSIPVLFDDTLDLRRQCGLPNTNAVLVVGADGVILWCDVDDGSVRTAQTVAQALSSAVPDAVGWLRRQFVATMAGAALMMSILPEPSTATAAATS